MSSKPAYIQIRAWIMAVIKQRRLLIRLSRSQINQVRAENTCNKLEMYLQTYSYASDNLIARFFLDNSSEILYLIPGRGSSSYDSRMKEYHYIYEWSNQILTNYGRQKQQSAATGNV